MLSIINLVRRSCRGITAKATFRVDSVMATVFVLILSSLMLFVLSAGQAHADGALVAEYRFDDVAWCTPVTALDTVGGHHGTLNSGVTWQDSPASGGKPINGSAAGFSGGAIDILGLPVDTTANAVNSVSFWMFWDGTNNVMPLGFGAHDLWLQGGSFGFNTFNSDIYGIASAGLAGGWHHVAAVFTNGNVAANKLWVDGVPQALTQRSTSPNNANAVVSSHMRLSGVWGYGGYQFSGMLDGVRVYTGLLTQSQIDADRALTSPGVNCPPPPPPTLLAHYRLDDNWEVTHSAVNSVTGGPTGNFLTTYATKVAAPKAAPNKPNTCSGAAFNGASGSMRSTGVAFDLNAGGKNSVSFWMYWTGGNSQMPFGFALHDLWLSNGYFGFNTAGSDVYGISSAGLANGWHHVAAVFTNGNMSGNKLWIDGVLQTLTLLQGTPDNTKAYASSTFQLSSWTNDNNYRFGGTIDEVKLYRGALTDAMVLSNASDICVVADWQMDEPSWNGTANEVKDSGAGLYHGRARIANGSTSVPSTSFVSPAKSSGSTSTCSYGEFDQVAAPVRTYSYVELSSFPPLPSSFTFAAWIRSTNASAQHQRILVRDDANDGWGLSLADGTGQPELRFFNRSITNSGVASGQGRNPNCGVFCLDTDPVLTSNAWYYIAAAIDTAGKTVTLYVFDAAGVLKAQTSSAFAGNWVDGTGLVTIGGESSASSEGTQAAWHFLGNIDELRIFSGVLSLSDIQSMLARTRTCVGLAIKPANFNCVESGANASTGHLYTKRAGSPFAFDVVALKADGSVETTYASDSDKTVTIEWVDGAGAAACSARSAISPAVSQTLGFTKANQPLEQGRKSVASMTVSKAYADLRCRVTDANQSPSIVGCSTDDFAVRPSNFTVTSSANADGSGASASAVPAIKTGSNFSLTAASGVVGYDALPKIDPGQIGAHVGGVQTGTLAGAFGNADPTTGSATGASFTYSEVGYVNLAANGVYDDSFTAVDSSVGDCTADFSNAAVGGKVGCMFGNASTTPYFGRFIPDHFKVMSPTFTPGCSAGSYTYMDQVLTLNATVEAQNSTNAATKNYSGTFAKGVISVQMENANNGIPVPVARLAGLVAPGWSAGVYPFAATRFSRSAGPDGPYDALDIGLDVADETALAANARPYLQVRDMDASSITCAPDLTGLSIAAGVCTATKMVSATRVRFGRLRIGNAYGSELLDLSVPVQSQYWNGTAFVQNSADNCTSLAGSNVSLARYQGGLSAVHMGASHVIVAPIVAGIGRIKLTKPTPATQGSVDLFLNLGSVGSPSNCPGLAASGSVSAALPYLSGMWCGSNSDRDPVARATFGVFKSPLIYRRENY